MPICIFPGSRSAALLPAAIVVAGKYNKKIKEGGNKHPFICSDTPTSTVQVSPLKPPGHFHSSVVSRHSCIHNQDVHFQGCTFRPSALKWLRPSSPHPPSPSGEMGPRLHFSKGRRGGADRIASHAKMTAEPKWHFNSARPLTSPHSPAPPDLKRVP